MKEKIFKDSMNKWITSGLFKETTPRENFVIYTLEEARQAYIECNDPTGYLYSTKYLGGYKHWMALKESPALSGHIEDWEEELEVKIRAEALQKIYTESQGVKGYSASKYLVEAGWMKKKQGRPNKDDAKKKSRVRSKIYDEFGLTSVK